MMQIGITEGIEVTGAKLTAPSSGDKTIDFDTAETIFRFLNNKWRFNYGSCEAILPLG